MGNDNKYYDIHAHFLPSMDLGCKNVNDAMQMVRMMEKQHCQGVIATPHFYPTETVDVYLKRRKDNYAKLKEALSNSELADFDKKIVLGTEVSYHHSLVFDRNLASLCLGDSNYLLLELPFSKWSNEVLEDIEHIMRYRGLKVVIAHLERFYEYGNKKLIAKLLDMDVIIQMNTAHVLKFGAFRHAQKMIKNQRVDVLCTDCHGKIFYPPNMEQALEKMRKNGLEKDMTRMLQNGFAIYKMAKS